ncbi:MAG: DUF2147 domain-containing protein [Pseudomonadota bacterium]
MKSLTTAFCIGLLSAGMAFAADPVEGVWQTEPGDEGNFAHVTVEKCGEQICGVLGQAYNSAGQKIDSPNKGRQMIWDMNSDGGGKYSGGKIWAPDRDKVYKSKMSLSGNALKVSGCVAVICRSQNWVRVK